MQWERHVLLSNASVHTNFSKTGTHFLSATALNSIIVNQEHMVFLAWPAPPLPTTLHRCIQCHTHYSPLFSRLVYKLEQLRVAATSCRAVPPQSLSEWGFLMNWRHKLVQPNFSD